MAKPIVTSKTRLLMEACTKCDRTGWYVNGETVPCDMCDQRGWYIHTYDIEAPDLDVIFPKLPAP